VNTTRKFGSDVMVDVLRAYDIEYIALNPGSSFRGLHDSLVNYADGSPAIVQTTHEKIALGIAHGYAKASGKMMAAAVHNVVGLLNSSLGLYFAYTDRVPLLLLGGAGPMALEHRRPRTDWFHVANVQGNAVRDFTKWDDQPASLESVPLAMARAYKQATMPPRGPVYIALDADIQEREVLEDLEPPDFRRLGTPTGIAPDEASLQRLAELLVLADCPVLVPGHVGPDPASFRAMIDLAEVLGAGVVDTGIRLAFPNRHPLALHGTDIVREADVVVFIDVHDPGAYLVEADWTTRTNRTVIRSDARVASLGLSELNIGSWSHEFGGLYEFDIDIVAEPALGLPRLVEACRALVAARSSDEELARAARRRRFAELHTDRWSAWQTQAEDEAGLAPVATSRLAAATWEVVRRYDWVLTAGTANDWARRLWDFDLPYRHPGGSLGAASQFSLSLGVALAHKGTGRLVVDLQPDGDLLYDVGALWTAAHYDIPLLVVMFNNRAYYNDLMHQELVARHRSRPVENAHIGQELSAPAPDFAGLARSFGWRAWGPVSEPERLVSQIAEAADYVINAGKPALVDVVCQMK
jgi:acetolactate synthase I/II/III large subunit